MYKVGITGGIGSGKSLVADMLLKRGVALYSSDSRAKELMASDPELRQQLVERFGSEVFCAEGLNRAYLAERVFASDEELKALNAIVHPAVHQDILKKFRSTSEPLNSSSAASEPSVLFFIECAILYTAHLDQLCDKVVVVTAPEEVRLARTIARDHSDIDKVRARMRAQDAMQDLKRADIVIHNDGQTEIPTLCEQIISELLAKG